jgi:NAD(P)-dependent dehydrogenase (short-subunit alcohol dehydrogenase family)
MKRKSVKKLFDLSGRTAVITGGGGFLGVKHAEAIAWAGGIPFLADLDGDMARDAADRISYQFNVPAQGIRVDVTDENSVEMLLNRVIDNHGSIDILVNNAANNPKMEADGELEWSRLENFSTVQLENDLSVGLIGSFICSRIIGAEMARRGKGVIVNIASDLSVIAPDQRIYWKSGVTDDQQPVKPVSYSVVKSGLIGLTRYLATYWADNGVRVNALSPGGVFNGQPKEFVAKLTSLIPMGRMARSDEYQGALVFLCSDASSYMTGANLSVDGGRTAW